MEAKQGSIYQVEKGKVRNNLILIIYRIHYSMSVYLPRNLNNENIQTMKTPENILTALLIYIIHTVQPLGCTNSMFTMFTDV